MGPDQNFSGIGRMTINPFTMFEVNVMNAQKSLSTAQLFQSWQVTMVIQWTMAKFKTGLKWPLTRALTKFKVWIYTWPLLKNWPSNFTYLFCESLEMLLHEVQVYQMHPIPVKYPLFNELPIHLVHLMDINEWQPTRTTHHTCFFFMLSFHRPISPHRLTDIMTWILNYIHSFT